MKKEIPFKRALLEIALVTFMISGGAAFFLHVLLPLQKRQSYDPRYHITSIVQTGPQKEALKTLYLAELLDISCDRPTSFFRFDIKQGEKKLRASPVIKEARLKIEKPGILHIDYTVRKPIAWLADFSNCAIDEEGYLFPVYPFFSPKKLPEIYLGLSPFGKVGEDLSKPVANWNTPLEGAHFTLALKILTLLSDSAFSDYFNVKRIDVTNAFLESYGMREVVLIVEDEIIQEQAGKDVQFILPRILRLSTKNYAQELGNYLILRKDLLEKERAALPLSVSSVMTLPQKIIDFRIPNLAFIDEKACPL